MKRARRSRRGADPARVAAVIHRLAVLLAAGVGPVAAWGYLEEGEPTTSIARLVNSGIGVPEAIVAGTGALPTAERESWRALAAAWTVATDAGASLAPTLIALAATQRDLTQAARDVAVALAGPVATARLVIALPGVGVLFGYALGFDTVGTLVTTPLGWACLVIGGVLLAVAALWNRRLVRSAPNP